MVKADHDFFQFIFRHAAMGYTNRQTRNHFPQTVGNAVQGLNPVMDIVDAAATADLPFNGFFNHAIIVFCHIGFYWQSVFRR